MQPSSLIEHLKDPGHVLIREKLITPARKKEESIAKKDIPYHFISKSLNLSFKIMENIFHDVYWLEKECLPFSKGTSLHDLCSLNDSPITTHYRDAHSTKEIMICLSSVIRQRFREKIARSFFGASQSIHLQIFQWLIMSSLH